MKKALKIIGIVLAILLIGLVGLLYYVRQISPNSNLEARNNAQASFAKGTRTLVLSAIQSYYNEKNTVPQEITDLASLNANGVYYMQTAAQTISVLDYHYIDTRHAEVCILVESPVVEQKCITFAGI